jgi:hypothetical protein
MSTRGGRTWRMAALLAVAACLCGGATVPSDDAGVDGVVLRLRKAQAGARSLRCTWQQRDLHPAGSLSVVPAADLVLRPSDPPTGDAWSEAAVSLVVAGGRARHDYQGTLWDETTGRFEPYNEQGVLADGESRLYSPTNNGGSIARQGPTVDMLSAQPVYFAYFLFDPVLGAANADSLQVVGTGAVQGLECAILEKEREAGLRDNWWVALSGTDKIVRWQLLGSRDALLCQADMAYEGRVAGLPRLDHWTTSMFSDGSLVASSTCAVQSIALNGGVSDEEFRLEFPPGALVSDAIGGYEYVVAGLPGPDQGTPLDRAMDSFIGHTVEKTGDGTMRPIDAEPGDGRRVPARDRGGVAMTTEGRPSVRWLIVAIPLAFLAGFALYSIRRRAAS